MLANTYSAPVRPNEYAENALLNAILDGSFPAGSALPGERILAAHIGVTRPTLREAIQRLARDGWLTVAQGKPTIVNNYWEEGGLNVLSKLVEHQSHLPDDFVSKLLEVRLHLAPVYSRSAIEVAGDEIAEFLDGASRLEDTPVAFTRFDWKLHHLLTIRSRNPIYTLILNGFRDFYDDIGCQYFSTANARQSSRRFYEALRLSALAHDGESAERVCREVMENSILIWQQGAGSRNSTGG